MQPPFYHLRTLIVCLLTVTIFLGSCKKTIQPRLAPTSSITGVVTPSRAALSVVAVRDAQTYTSVPAAYGRFTFQDLVPGTYVVYAMPDSNYSAPAATTITLQSGQPADVGTITLSQKATATATLYITCAPPGATTAIKVTNQASRVITTFQPSYASTSSSSFTVVVPAGTYTVSVIAAAEYQAPPDTSVTLVAGRTYAFTTLNMQPVTSADAGQVTGTVVPSGIVTRMTISKTNTPLQYSVTPDGAGRFSFANVAPGTYSLLGSVGLTSPYYAPALFNIVVNPYQRVDLGAINLLPDTRSLSYYVNDSIYRKAVFFSCSLSSSKLTISGSIGFASATVLRLTIEGFNGSGQYVCGTTAGTNILYQEPYNSGIPEYTMLSWNSNVTAGSGTITVTSYDPVAKKISGTFSGNLPSANTGIFAGRSPKIISKGVFTDMVYP